MGTADAVPGVSGGTVALIAGVYARLIEAVTAISANNVVGVLQALVPPFDREGIRNSSAEFDLGFLLPLGFGIVTAIVLVTRVVHYADENHPVELYGLFFGLIAASALVLLRDISLAERRHLLAAVGGFILAFVLSGEGSVLSGHGPAFTFVAGMVAVSAMLLPGISGALILVILGQYTYLSATLSTFTTRLAGLPMDWTTHRLVESGVTVFVFLGGAVVGLLTVSRVVDRALSADRETTLAFLVSLVVGALRAPVVQIGTRESLDWTTGTTTEFVLVAIVGAVLLLALDRYTVASPEFGGPR